MLKAGVAFFLQLIGYSWLSQAHDVHNQSAGNYPTDLFRRSLGCEAILPQQADQDTSSLGDPLWQLTDNDMKTILEQNWPNWPQAHGALMVPLWCVIIFAIGQVLSNTSNNFTELATGSQGYHVAPCGVWILSLSENSVRQYFNKFYRTGHGLTWRPPVVCGNYRYRTALLGNSWKIYTELGKG